GRTDGQRAAAQPAAGPPIPGYRLARRGMMVDVSVIDHRPKRGELRIYLGAAPGVGKTYAMLGEAHRRLERGTDLVAAVIETHGRAKTTELLAGIETVSPHYVEYRGTNFAELDVPAVL